MALELEHFCPFCGEDRSFHRSASMTLHLGTKYKWACPECEYRFVTVDSELDSADNS